VTASLVKMTGRWRCPCPIPGIPARPIRRSESGFGPRRWTIIPPHNRQDSDSEGSQSGAAQ
jgi:hypothetical protein